MLAMYGNEDFDPFAAKLEENSVEEWREIDDFCDFSEVKAWKCIWDDFRGFLGKFLGS